MKATEAEAYCQRWTAAEDERWWLAAPAVGRCVMVDAAGFPARVNELLRALPPAPVVVLSDGFGSIGPADLERLVATAADADCLVRVRGTAEERRPEAALLAAPGAALAELGLHPGLARYYWADELEDSMGAGVSLEAAWVDYDEDGRQAFLGAWYYEAISDLATMEAGR